MSHILQTEEEFETEAPESETPKKTIKPDEEGCEEFEKQRRKMELDCNEARSHHRKKLEDCEEAKEILTSKLISRCSTHVLTNLEARDDWKQIRFSKKLGMFDSMERDRINPNHNCMRWVS